MVTCKNCGTERIGQAKFCSECGTKFELGVVEQEQLIRQKVKEQVEAKLSAIRDGSIISEPDAFLQMCKSYLSASRDLLDFQEEHVEELIKGFKEKYEEDRSHVYYQREIDKGRTFEELLEEEQVLKDVYFKETELDVLKIYIRSEVNSHLFDTMKESYLTLAKADRRTYANKDKGSQKQHIEVDSSDDIDLLDIADAALAFMSPVSAARYLIKKAKE